MRKITLITGALLAVVLPLLVVAQTTDTTPPSTPTNIVAVVNSSSEVDLSWSASSDNVGVVGYKIYRNDTQIATTTGASFQNTGLSPATTYVYMIAAYDAAGNVSAKSSPVPAATQSPSLGSTGSGATAGDTSSGIPTSGTPTSGGGTTPGAGTTPSSNSSPYQFQRQGIFDCNQNGSYAMSVGALGAIGGAYVPVADAAVELNTGTLVYKECVLREVVDREREAATSAFLKRATIGIQTGRDGNPQYVQRPSYELLINAQDPAVLQTLQDGTFKNLPPSTQGVITQAAARGYRAETRSPQNVLKCPYKGDLAAYSKGTPGTFTWGNFWATRAPGCDAVQGYYAAENLLASKIARASADLEFQWTTGNGYYARTDDAQDPFARKILTPSINMEQSYQALLDSPVHQLESANDIGQMISALYAGVTTQIISDNKGLAGLTQSSGGQPSYLDQVAAESAQGVRNAAVNAALQILNAAKQVEGAYYQTTNAIATLLSNAISQLRSGERQCWSIVIQKVCATPLAGDNTCFAQGPCTVDPVDGTKTCAPGPKLKVATSTAFSQPIITAQITPLATTTLTNITVSQKALQSINNLIGGLTNTASLDAQRLALQQLDSLVAQRALHNQQDLVQVTQQKEAVDASMQTLVQDTVKAWADSGDPVTGWCNVNNSAVIDMWVQKWKI